MEQTAITDPQAPRPPRVSGKQRVLEAAERLFSSKGFLEVSAAEIAKEAGVAHGLLFHHFGSMEDLYAEVSRLAIDRMDRLQLASFKGKTPRARVRSFLRAHMRAMKARESDAVYRARLQDVGFHTATGLLWEGSRQRAIGEILRQIGIAEATPKQRLCLRAWLSFHDRLVTGWLADHSLKETEVLEWSLAQFAHLAVDVLGIDIDQLA